MQRTNFSKAINEFRGGKCKNKGQEEARVSPHIYLLTALHYTHFMTMTKSL